MSTRLPIETGNIVRLEISVEDYGGARSRNVVARMVGLDQGGFVLVRVDESLVSDLFPQIAKDGRVVVRYLYDGHVFGFFSRVMKKTLDPAPLIYLTYPNEVEKMNLRREPRTKCNLPARLVSDGVSLSSAVLDLSNRGCRLVVWTDGPGVLEAITPETPVSLEVDLPGEAVSVTLESVVKNVKPEEGFFSTGLAFDNPGSPAREKLCGYLERVPKLWPGKLAESPTSWKKPDETPPQGPADQ